MKGWIREKAFSWNLQKQCHWLPEWSPCSELLLPYGLSQRKGVGIKTVHSTHLCSTRCHNTIRVSRNYYYYADFYYSLSWPVKNIVKFIVFVFIPFFSNFWYQILFCQDEKWSDQFINIAIIVTKWVYSPWSIFKVLFKTKESLIINL